MKNYFKSILCFAVLGIVLVGCSSDRDQDETAGFSVQLVDAPGDYEAVLVDVQGVEAIIDGETIDLGPAETGVYDLLELTGGISALLAEGVLPAGNLSQIRLILGEDNNLVIDGDEVDLKTPSAQQSGLKVNIHQSLEPGIFYEFILDFNVDKSVTALGNGEGYILAPVIRATTVAESGAVVGVVTPAETQSLVTASNGTEEISAYTNEESGEFLLYGVPSGTYAITITPDANSGLSEITLEDVEVVKGESTDLGIIALE